VRRKKATWLTPEGDELDGRTRGASPAPEHGQRKELLQSALILLFSPPLPEDVPLRAWMRVRTFRSQGVFFTILPM
jgi:hypothetical protein